MKLQIIEIVLWPKSTAFTPRRLAFAMDKANVITGASKTGKSSIIPIIDYCFASDRCSIPVGLIRQAVSWFGVVIQTSEGRKLLARPEPGNAPSVGEMYIDESELLTIPEVITSGNTNVKQVKNMFDRLAQLTMLGTDVGSQVNGYLGRPSFRDLMAFCFQPQNVVANPDVLFYRADTNEHREKLRAIFPYILGATTPESLEKRWELEQLRREFRVKQREADAYAKASDIWHANLQNWVAEAQELGLITKDDLKNKNESSVLEMLSVLVAKGISDKPISADALADAAIKYAELRQQEAELNLKIGNVRHRLTRVSDIRSSVSQFELSIEKRKDRLSLSRWLRGHSSAEGAHECPVCSQEITTSITEIDAMCDALAVLESDARRVSKAPAIYDRDWLALKNTLQDLTDKLNAVIILRKGIEQRNTKARQETLLTTQVARYFGALEQALEVYHGRENPHALDELEDISDRIKQLQHQLEREDYAGTISNALKRVGRSMEKLSALLDAEDPRASVNLDIKELTVKVGAGEERTDFLWQLGSGANWLTYHVAATLALHAFFAKLPHSPVPGLLVYDQPSQVYFPRKLSSRSADTDPKIADEDVTAVRRFFKVFGQSAVSFSGGFQVIVVDHASPEIWEGLEGVELVEEWRNGHKLVPTEWIDAIASKSADEA